MDLKMRRRHQRETLERRAREEKEKEEKERVRKRAVELATGLPLSPALAAATSGWAVAV